MSEMESAAQADTSATATAWWSMSSADVVVSTETDVERGLSEVEAASRLERDGPNELPETPGPSAWWRLGQQFADPLIVLLLVAILISALAWWGDGAEGAPIESIVIAIIIVANALIGFWQEGRAISAVAALRELTAAQTTVLRDGGTERVPSSTLVAGDVIVLVEGDTVGFDGRLVESASLEANEAALTGESLPVDKSVEVISASTELAERVNMVFSGTSITRGRGRAVVVATGLRTEVGHIASLLDETTSERTPLQRQVDHLGRVLGIAVIILAAVVVASIVLTSDLDTMDEALDALLVAVSLAVAAVPEGLPAILTVVLALGVQRMSRRNAIVKRLLSVETLGSASVICTDKTGTLTRNEMTVVTAATSAGQANVSGAGYEPSGELDTDDPVLVEEVGLMLWAAGAASDATLERRGDRWVVSGDPTEVALVVAEAKVGTRDDRIATSVRLDEVPFDSDRKLMSTFDRVEPGSGPWSGLVQFTKGAPDVLLERCTTERRDRSDVGLTDARRSEIHQLVDGFADVGLRTLAIATRSHPSLPDPCDESTEYDLVWLGVVGIADPPRDEVAGVIADATQAGIRTVVLTGDHPRTAAAIGGALGIPSTRPPVTGRELDTIDWSPGGPAEELVGSATIFARVAPEHKLRIVQTLQRTGQIVAMTGDGVNDAPALRQADIGVAMGGIGTDVSREAADMILTDDDFGTIVNAVEEGRNIFADIRKFLRYLLGSNSGEVLVMVIGVLGAGALGLRAVDDGLAVPLLATQILWINLLTDSALALALGVDPSVDDVMLQPPRKLSDPIVDRPMWTTIALVGTVSALAGLIALDLELAGGMLGGDGDLTSARTMVFTTVVLAQIFNAFNARSDSVSAFVKMFDNWLLWAAVALTVVLQVAVVHLGFLNRAFDTTPLDAGQWATCWALASLVLVANEIRKLIVRSRNASAV